MKTTPYLNDDLVDRAKKLAASERSTLSKLVEEGLALRLNRRRLKTNTCVTDLPVSKCRGGLRPGIDGTRNRSMFNAAGV